MFPYQARRTRLLRRMFKLLYGRRQARLRAAVAAGLRCSAWPSRWALAVLGGRRLRRRDPVPPVPCCGGAGQPGGWPGCRGAARRPASRPRRTRRLLPAIAGGRRRSCGLAAFYRALAIGTMSIVAPIAATGMALPVAVGFAQGDHPGPLQLAGMGLAASAWRWPAVKPPSRPAAVGPKRGPRPSAGPASAWRCWPRSGSGRSPSAFVQRRELDVGLGAAGARVGCLLPLGGAIVLSSSAPDVRAARRWRRSQSSVCSTCPPTGCTPWPPVTGCSAWWPSDPPCIPSSPCCWLRVVLRERVDQIAGGRDHRRPGWRRRDRGWVMRSRLIAIAAW